MKNLVFLLFLMFCGVAHAETYYVNTDVLNLRSCEGTNCKILGKLTLGETVEVITDNGEWVKVQTDKGDGFVIKRSLTIQGSGIGGIADVVMGALVITLILGFVSFFYFLPSIVARNNKNKNKVFWVNLLLGWIPIIWLLVLFAALIGDSREN